MWKGDLRESHIARELVSLLPHHLPYVAHYLGLGGRRRYPPWKTMHRRTGSSRFLDAPLSTNRSPHRAAAHRNC